MPIVRGGWDTSLDIIVANVSMFWVYHPRFSAGWNTNLGGEQTCEAHFLFQCISTSLFDVCAALAWVWLHAWI